MSPDVDTLVMDHKEAFQNFPGAVEIYPVSMRNSFVVFHVIWGFFVVPNVFHLFLVWSILKGLFIHFFIHLFS